MKAAYIEQPGPPENIRYGDLPTPKPQDAEVLVKVRAVSVNPIDTYIRSGAVAMPLPLPFVIGCDLAGVVESVGPAARRFKPGDRVWGSNQGLLGRQGTFAEYAAVDERWLYPTPESTTDEQAAATALVGITACLGLTRDAKVKAGETVFVHGGSGGVGSMVVQMAKSLGARVATTAGSPEKVARCRELGAELVVNYRTEDVEATVKEFAPEGVNLFWESLHEPNFDKAFAMLAPRGRMVVIAGRKSRPEFPLGPFYVKGCTLYGFAMFNATDDEQRQASQFINGWLASGALQANIDRVLPLAQAAEAHRLQEESTVGKSGALAGKIVLRP